MRCHLKGDKSRGSGIRDISNLGQVFTESNSRFEFQHSNFWIQGSLLKGDSGGDKEKFDFEAKQTLLETKQ